MGYWKNIDVCAIDAQERISKLNEKDSEYEKKKDEILVECAKNAELDKDYFCELYSDVF